MDNNQKVNRSISDDKNRELANQAGLTVSEAENVLAVLDLEVDVPDGLTEKVIQNWESVKIDTPSGFDFIKYLQLAAVLVGAMFFGVLLGKNADVHSFNKKHSREDHALMELRDKHHLSEDYTFGKL